MSRLDALVRHALPASAWVSISAGMPVCDSFSSSRSQGYTVVLVYACCSIEKALYYEKDGFRITRCPEGTQDGKELHELLVNGITHWMPMPEPPNTSVRQERSEAE